MLHVTQKGPRKIHVTIHILLSMQSIYTPLIKFLFQLQIFVQV